LDVADHYSGGGVDDRSKALFGERRGSDEPAFESRERRDLLSGKLGDGGDCLHAIGASGSDSLDVDALT
jgi:hypothetical protein